jgi:hypothetical protein
MSLRVSRLAISKTILKNQTMKAALATVSLETMIDDHIGKRGTQKRDVFENELKIVLLGHAIKQARKYFMLLATFF